MQTTPSSLSLKRKRKKLSTTIETTLKWQNNWWKAFCETPQLALKKYWKKKRGADSFRKTFRRLNWFHVSLLDRFKPLEEGEKLASFFPFTPYSDCFIEDKSCLKIFSTAIIYIYLYIHVVTSKLLNFYWTYWFIHQINFNLNSMKK